MSSLIEVCPLLSPLPKIPNPPPILFSLDSLPLPVSLSPSPSPSLSICLSICLVTYCVNFILKKQFFLQLENYFAILKRKKVRTKCKIFRFHLTVYILLTATMCKLTKINNLTKIKRC